MFGRLLSLLSTVVVAVMTTGCANDVMDAGGNDSSSVSTVASKAVDVASHVGGSDGFGGTLMDGYVDHMPGHMGFDRVGDLASAGENMMVLVRNESNDDGTFHVSYFSSHMGLDEQVMNVAVGAGEGVTIEIPCSEIVGVGSLDSPGEPGCHLDNGEVVDNMMAVPGFLGEDFTCDGIYECTLTPDVDDLDGDGDTEELIIVSDAMALHMMNGGPTGHMHGTGSGMMGPHMGM